MTQLATYDLYKEIRNEENIFIHLVFSFVVMTMDDFD